MNRDFYNVTALTTSHMKQVIDKLGGLKEEDLLKLDQAVYSYLLKRRENQKVQQSLQAGVRSQLSVLEQKNDYLLKEMQITMRKFKQQTQLVREQNKGLLDQTQYSGNPWEEICKELINDLSCHRSIVEYAQRIQQLKMHSIEPGYPASSAQEFFQRVAHIVDEEEEESSLKILGNSHIL